MNGQPTARVMTFLSARIIRNSSTADGCRVCGNYLVDISCSFSAFHTTQYSIAMSVKKGKVPSAVMATFLDLQPKSSLNDLGTELMF